MSIKRKLILMVICVGIILVVFTVNVVKRVQDSNSGTEDITVLENVMTRAEAYRLLSYLKYDKAVRETLPIGIAYADKQMSDWYDDYVNAVWKMGLIEGNVTTSPKEALTYEACKELTDKLILINPDYQVVYTGLSFDFTKAETNMLIPDFLELYKALLAVVPDEEKIVKEDTLLVLGREVTEEGIDRMVTDQGKYYYMDTKDYVNYYKQTLENTQSEDNAVTPATAVKGENQAVTPTEAVKEDSQAITPTGAAEADAVVSNGQTSLIDQFMDKGINVLVCDQEIICITSVMIDKIIVHNVWIKQGKDAQIDTFINGIDKSFTAISKLSSPIEKVIGDITIENQKIVKINVKPDMIKGKVLRTGKDYIEIEGYGEVSLDEDYKIYKIYGEPSMEPTGSILVGYENTDFIVSDGKISAALITESIKAENIRVLIETTGYKDIYHKKVEFTATSDFTVSSKTKEYSYSAGEKVTIEPSNELFEDGRITVKTSSDTAKIKLLSVERSSGNPKYRGSIEIAEEDSGLIIINELPLEEYLYAVIPSEMPTSYGVEALKVQAVCARSYAYRHLLANSLSEYGAHVNDSVAYQVYNNISENEDSILAVKDTYGEVIKYDDNVIIAYYFSTSCGHTTDPSSVWSNDVNLPYLDGKLIL
ncbi:MAG: SpoIID/LytB domain-containing protein, partial [Herbinix sp.]|nr:SpoIID/LytB domain-containing protein [Herbinix sp.]